MTSREIKDGGPAVETDSLGDILLRAIYDDVDHELNPENAECWNCGGEGYTYDCIDGCCASAEYGCATCERRCPECVIFAGMRARAVRLAVIESGSVDVAEAWLKDIGRWHEGITREQVERELADALLKARSEKEE